MTNNEKLQKIISAYAALPFQVIDLNRTIKNVYVFEAFKDNLADDICQAWPNEVDCTELHNELFVSLKTGVSIFDHYNIIGDADYK